MARACPHSPAAGPLVRFAPIFAAVVLAAGCQKKAPPPPPPKPPEVIVAFPVRQTVTDFEEYTGRLAPVRIVDLRARVSGYLEEVQFTDGADVVEGAPLFQIDARPFSAALAEAEANVAQLQARLERSRRQEVRLTDLNKRQITTDDELDGVKYLRMETDAELKAAQATVELARLNLEFTEIKSPLTGRISRRLVDPGNLVQADVTPLATIVALDPVYAYFDVDERTVLQVRRLIAKGEVTSARDKAIEVSLALADDDEFSLTGSVNFVDNQVSATTGTLRLRAEVQNPRKLLAPGMFVRVRVPIGLPHEAVLVREEALGSDQGQRFVYVLNDKNEVQYRRIKAGRLSAGLRVVAEGLTSDERVIVTGLQRVRPGVTVIPKFPDKDEAVSATDATAPFEQDVLVGPPMTAPESRAGLARSVATEVGPAISATPAEAKN